MKTPTQRRTVVFIVRVWAEYLIEQPPTWRGVLEVVGSGQKTPFTELNGLIKLIQQQTNKHIDDARQKGV